MHLLYSLISGIRFHVCLRVQHGIRLPEELKIVFCAVAKVRLQYFSRPRFYDDLRFERVAFFLSGVVFSLLFLGLSIADSLTSTITASMSGLSYDSFLFGNLNSFDRTKISSIFLPIL